MTTLQKQLLELQKIQQETKSKLDESRASIDALTTKVKELEEKTARPVPQPQIESKPTPTVQPQPEKKKPVKKQVKKKKPVRRQE